MDEGKENRMSYIVEVLPCGEDKWCGNGMVFDTEAAAKVYGADLFGRWFGITDWRAVSSDKTPNYRVVDGRLTAIKEQTE